MKFKIENGSSLFEEGRSRARSNDMDHTNFAVEMSTKTSNTADAKQKRGKK